MSAIRLMELASVIRSKNSGPYELTLDVFFKSPAIYDKARRNHLIDAALIRKLYGVRPEEVLEIVYFDPVHAVKATIARPVASGAVDDTDVYGAQQHMPLVDAIVEWE